MKVIGLAGSFGTGKSTVVQWLKEWGARVIDADKVGHELYTPGSEAWKEVVASFGSEILKPSGEIDRPRLGAIVFQDPQALKRLNQIMIPRIVRRVREVKEAWRQEGVKVAVVEAAILLEMGLDKDVDEIWVTVTPRDILVERLRQARGLTSEQVMARLNSQLSEEEKVRRAHVVLHNDGDLEALRRQVEREWQRLNCASMA